MKGCGLRIIAHLSDLHFGRVDAAVLPALAAALAAARPDLLVVSGDLTQRARAREFRDARRFLDTLPYPRLVVPGNHDIPLYNVLSRWLDPFRRFRHYIDPALEPLFVDAEMAVAGITTVRAGTVKNGRINRRQTALIARQLAHEGSGITRIVVTHHPFDLPAHASPDDLIGRSQPAMAAFAESRVDMVLSGHLHGSLTSDSVVRYGNQHRQILLVQAGTATSTRRRGEENCFNIIALRHPQVSISRMAWDIEAHCFKPAGADVFRRNGDAWRRERADDQEAN